MTRVTNVRQGIPDAMFAVLKYSQSFAPSSSGAVNQQFRGNSLFDPDLTGTGHQPLFFDQYATLYRRYMVYSCAITATISNQDTVPIHVALIPTSESSVSLTTAGVTSEKPYVRWVQVGPNSGTSSRTVSNRMSTRKMRGGAQMDDSFGATTSENPSRQWFWNLVTNPQFSGTYNCQINVILTYRCRFYSRVSVLQS